MAKEKVPEISRVARKRNHIIFHTTCYIGTVYTLPLHIPAIGGEGGERGKEKGI